MERPKGSPPWPIGEATPSNLPGNQQFQPRQDTLTAPLNQRESLSAKERSVYLAARANPVQGFLNASAASLSAARAAAAYFRNPEDAEACRRLQVLYARQAAAALSGASRAPAGMLRAVAS